MWYILKIYLNYDQASNRYDKHPISTAGGNGIRKPVICEIELPLHFPFEKSIIKSTMQYLKDRSKCFDYFLYKSKKCKLKHIKNWLKLFVDYHNMEINLMKSLIKCASPFITSNGNCIFDYCNF